MEPQPSPRVLGRTAGVLYLIIAITAPFAEVFVRGRVRGDAAATASKIVAQESLYRWGGAADLVNLVCDTALAVVFYQLFRSVSRSAALLSAFFRLMHVAVMAVATLFHFAPLLLLRPRSPWRSFTPEQLQDMTALSLRLHGQGYNLCLIFFGVACAVLGYLIIKSRFMPRWLGIAVTVAGVAYIINSFAAFISPAFRAVLQPFILIPIAIGELSLIVYLVVVGARENHA